MKKYDSGGLSATSADCGMRWYEEKLWARLNAIVGAM
jgi:hypothetical protein